VRFRWYCFLVESDESFSHTVGAGDDDVLDRMEGELEEGEQHAQNYYRY
jgi:hypothetical protein